MLLIVGDNDWQSLKLWSLIEDAKKKIFLLIDWVFSTEEIKQSYISIKVPFVPAACEAISYEFMIENVKNAFPDTWKVSTIIWSSEGSRKSERTLAIVAFMNSFSPKQRIFKLIICNFYFICIIKISIRISLYYLHPNNHLAPSSFSPILPSINKQISMKETN